MSQTPKRHLDRFSRFCTAHLRVQRTDRHTDHTTCVICSNRPHLMHYVQATLPYKIYTKLHYHRQRSIGLHCSKAHSKINRKMENSTPCKIVTPENFILKLGTRDYVENIT